MLFYGVDITDKFEDMGLDPDFIQTISAVSEGIWDADIIPDTFRVQDDNKTLHIMNEILASPHPFTDEPEKQRYNIYRYRFSAMALKLVGEQIEILCPWLNDLRAVLQGEDAVCPLIYGQDTAEDDADNVDSWRMLVGFWPADFPLEIGKSALPKEFLEQATWLSWADNEYYAELYCV